MQGDYIFHRITGPRRGQCRNYTVTTTQKNIDLLTDLSETENNYISLISDQTLYLQLSDTEADTIDETKENSTDTDEHVMMLPPSTRLDFVIRGDEKWLHAKSVAAGNMFVWVSSQDGT